MNISNEIALRQLEEYQAMKALKMNMVGSGVYSTSSGAGLAQIQSAAKSLMQQGEGSKVVFDAQVKVSHVANGYIVEITKLREPFDNVREVMVAKDIQEVNEIIAAAMVSFRLEA